MFDAGERFDRLLDACITLGFSEEADIYRKIIQDTADSGIKARPESMSSAFQQRQAAESYLGVPLAPGTHRRANSARGGTRSRGGSTERSVGGWR